MDSELRRQLRDIIQNEVVMATGCTEPVAVALCVAKTCETLGAMPDTIELYLSKNVFKNAMGVGIPGSGMIGLPIAVAMAVTAGRADKELRVLDLSPAEIDNAKAWLANNAGNIRIAVEENSDKLYIRCRCRYGNDEAEAIIARRHTHFAFLRKGGQVLIDAPYSTTTTADSSNYNAPQLSAAMVYEYATTAPLEEIAFIRETVRLNKAASDEGMQGYGLRVGSILQKYAGNDSVHNMVARTAAASDARMDGCLLPIYSNSGSGNQGITCTLPVYEYGTSKQCSDEQITRALVLSHLMSIYIKRGIGRLSALCGIVNASMGVSAAITYLNGGNLTQICYAIKNMINSITGMVCDGAKPSCAIKIAIGIYSANIAADLAINDSVVDTTDGLAENDIDHSIHNLCRLGHDGMNETDDMILSIMTNKRS